MFKTNKIRVAWLSAAAVVLLLTGLWSRSDFWPHTTCPTPSSEKPKGSTPPSPLLQRATPAARLPACRWQAEGAVETLHDVLMHHHYVASSGITWHVVAAGQTNAPVAVFVHGFPETWFAFHQQMAALANDRLVVAVDVPPYGQSEKPTDIDYAFPALAERVLLLLQDLKVRKFDLITHDRGSVIGDHAAAIAQNNQQLPQIRRYVRMQQSANEPHGEPKPPHALMASVIGSFAFRGRGFIKSVYSGHLVANHIPDPIIERIAAEFSLQDTATLARRSFATTSFDQELEDRHNSLFDAMTMPVLFLQGRLDPGQHEAEYAQTPQFVANGRVEFVEAGHFLHLEAPQAVNRVMRQFLLTEAN